MSLAYLVNNRSPLAIIKSGSILALFQLGLRLPRYLAARQRWHRLLSLLINLPRHRRMLHTISGKPFREIRLLQPQLGLKYLNPNHIAHGLSTKDRAEAMIHHYNLLNRVFHPTILEAISRQGALLWEINDEKGRHRVLLKFSHPTDNEGELTIEYIFDGTLLHVLSFTFVSEALVGGGVETVILISRNQGVQASLEKRRIAMQMLYGLSASRLLVSTIQGIAEGLGLSQIIGVSAQRQVCRSQRAIHLQSAYDDVFLNLGGIEADGLFKMRLPFQDKPLLKVRNRDRDRIRLQRQVRQSIVSGAQENMMFSTM